MPASWARAASGAAMAAVGGEPDVVHGRLKVDGSMAMPTGGLRAAPGTSSAVGRNPAMKLFRQHAHAGDPLHAEHRDDQHHQRADHQDRQAGPPDRSQPGRPRPAPAGTGVGRARSGRRVGGGDARPTAASPATRRSRRRPRPPPGRRPQHPPGGRPNRPAVRLALVRLLAPVMGDGGQEPARSAAAAEEAEPDGRATTARPPASSSVPVPCSGGAAAPVAGPLLGWPC